MRLKSRNDSIPFLPVIAVLMILIPMLMGAGCTGNVPAPGGQLPAGPEDGGVNPAVPGGDGTRWALTGYRAGDTMTGPLTGTTITLEFQNGTLTGMSGCNHYFAGYTAEGVAITIGPAGSTEMYCTGPGVMEQEAAYLGILSRAASVNAAQDTLVFADSAGTTLLTFARILPPPPASLEGTNWTLDSLYSGNTVSSVLSGTTVTAFFDSNGRVSGSSGCNRYSGSYAATATSLTIASVGSTKMNCPGSGVMLQEGTFLAALGETKGYAVEGNRLTLTGAGGGHLLSFTADA